MLATGRGHERQRQHAGHGLADAVRPTQRDLHAVRFYPTGAVGNVVSKGVNELIIPNYKQTWGNIRKLADAPQVTRHLSFKSEEYGAST